MSSEFIKEVTDDNFAAEVEGHTGLVMVDFWATWCGPCRALGPTVEELAQEYSGKLKVTKLNVDDSQMTAAKYGIRGIPTLLFFKGGQVVQQVVGLQPKKKLAQTIDTLL